MVRKKKDVTDAELAVMEQLWLTGGATIRTLTDEIYPSGGDSEYATVKKLLARLSEKKFVRRDESQHAHRYEPAVSKEDLIGRRLQDLADTLCDGSKTPLLMHLLSNEKLPAKDRKQLQQLVDKLSANNKRKRGSK